MGTPKLFSFFKNNESRWITYDWANSVFATSIISGLFPILLRQYWAQGIESEKVTLYLGLCNSIISLCLFLILPFLGFLMDSKIQRAELLLFASALAGSFFTASLYFVDAGSLFTALFLYSISFIFFALGNSQCDSLLKRLKSPWSTAELDRVSSLGYSFGYLGGGLCLFLQALSIIFYKELGFKNSLQPAKLAFLSSALWWAVFSLPLLYLKLVPLQKNQLNKSQISYFGEIKKFFSGINKETFYFLCAFFLYIDVVYTTYKMAVDFGLSLGLKSEQLIGVLLYVQILGAPSTLLMNKVAKKWGRFKALYLCLFCYGLVVVLAPFTYSILFFVFLASFIAFAQGGLQSLSRSYFAELIDPQQQGIGFGFINIFGKLSAILGPLFVALTAFIFKSHRLSMLSLLPFLIGGLYFLRLSQKEKAK